MVTYLQSTAVEFEKGTDTDILITGGIYWSVVECGVGLISCCLPTVYGVFRSKAAKATLKSTRLTSLDSHPFHRNSRTGHLPRGVTKGLDSHWADSQGSAIELAVSLPQETRTTAKAEGLADVESWGAESRDQILITKTFGSWSQSARNETI